MENILSCRKIRNTGNRLHCIVEDILNSNMNMNIEVLEHRVTHLEPKQDISDTKQKQMGDFITQHGIV